MSSNYSNHEFNDFTPVAAALDLALHVIQITENNKIFPEYEIKDARTKQPSKNKYLKNINGD